MSLNNIIYFDNAATSFPKPAAVIEAVTEYMTRVGGNPGRSGHRLSVEAGEIVFDAREQLSKLFGVMNPMRIVLGYNATDALNLGIQGLLRDGDHVITTSMEHNSTARPLHELQRAGRISLTVVPCSSQGALDPDDVRKCIGPSTRLAVINHGSNVFGTVQPVKDIGMVCRNNGIVLLVDAAQTAGIVDIDLERDFIDLLAFAGHKGLYGPTGTGGLAIGNNFDFRNLMPLKFGGTGSHSDSIEQPRFLPDIYESGTLNVAGLAGLGAGVAHVRKNGDDISWISLCKKELVRAFHGSAREKVQGYVPFVDVAHIETGVVSFALEGMETSLVAQYLSDDYGIMCRAGLHCAPLAHKTMGTFPEGTIRFGFGVFNTIEEVDTAVEALGEISRMRR